MFTAAKCTEQQQQIPLAVMMEEGERGGVGLTNSSAIGLQGHAAVLLLQVLMAEQDPGRVVRLV